MNANVKNINKPRNANMDILRIVSMLLIVFCNPFCSYGFTVCFELLEHRNNAVNCSQLV